MRRPSSSVIAVTVPARTARHLGAVLASMIATAIRGLYEPPVDSMIGVAKQAGAHMIKSLYDGDIFFLVAR